MSDYLFGRVLYANDLFNKSTIKPLIRPEDLVVKSGAGNLRYARQFLNLFETWPNCIQNDFNQRWLGFKTIALYPQYQFMIVYQGRLLGYVSTIPVKLEPEATKLPHTGYTWAIHNGISHIGKKKNALCALAAVLDPDLKGLGLSDIMVKLLKNIAQEFGFDRLIAPVRPTLKPRYPDESMACYINRKTSTNEIFDPWLRHHINNGGVIRNVCEESIIVRADAKTWTNWLEAPLTDGPNYFHGGLSPMIFDPEQQQGTYREPNVWVDYQLKEDHR